MTQQIPPEIRDHTPDQPPPIPPQASQAEGRGNPNFILFIILAMSVPQIFMLFRKRTDEEKRYFELNASQRMTMAIMYFGLVGLLVLGMHYTHILPPTAEMQ